MHYDVVIIGGGPAGSATALGLARHRVGRHGPFRTLIIEQSDYRAPRVGETLLPDARRLLGDLDVADAFDRDPHEPCVGSRSAWGSDRLGFNDFLFKGAGTGWHLDRVRFDHFLAKQAVAAGTDLKQDTRFQFATQTRDGWRIGASGPEGRPVTVTATLIVDATGAPALFARRQGARRMHFDQTLFAYRFFAQANAGTLARMTLIEAAADGWWYAAHLPGNRLCVAYATGSGGPEAKSHGNVDDWIRRLTLTGHVTEFIGDAQPDGDVRLVPAPSFQSSRTSGTNWMAVGDAASSFDPITGQGLHKALADGLLASDYIAYLRDGRIDGFSGYDRAVSNRFAAYQAARQHFYGLETRWPDNPFWAERRGTGNGPRMSLSNTEPAE